MTEQSGLANDISALYTIIGLFGPISVKKKSEKAKFFFLSVLLTQIISNLIFISNPVQKRRHNSRAVH